jgi:hypothetical protein
LTDLEERILIRLADQLSQYHPCSYHRGSINFHLLPNVAITTIEDRDTQLWWAASWLDNSGTINLERFALDEFDRLRLYLDGLSHRLTPTQ